MKIKSTFSDIYDNILSSIVQGYDNHDHKEMTYNRSTKEIYFDKEEIETNFSSLLDLVTSFNNKKDWQNTTTKKNIIQKIENQHNIKVETWSFNKETSLSKKTAVVILGLDIYVANVYAYEQISINNNLNTYRTENMYHIVEFEKYGNILDLKINIPTLFMHNPLAIIKINNSTDYKFKDKKYSALLNFSLSKHNWLRQNQDDYFYFHKAPFFTKRHEDIFENNNFINDLDLQVLYNSIESRLFYDKEQTTPMVEVSNSDKIKKAGFNDKSFKKR